jgi:hypothetical protein
LEVVLQAFGGNSISLPNVMLLAPASTKVGTYNWEYFAPDVCAHLGRSWCEQHHVWKTDAISAKSLQHYFQNGIEGRFQEFSTEYTEGKQRRITSDIPISTIDKVPIAIFYGD